MIKKLFSKLAIFAFVFALLIPASAGATSTEWETAYGFDDLDTMTGYDNNTPDLKATAVNIVNLVLGFLGLIAVVIILIGGFKWMTAGGNEEKVGEAKKLLIAGLIGLVIILLAWGIATWVISTLQDDVLSVTS